MTFQPNTANTAAAAAAADTADTADTAAESQAAFPLSRDETHRLLEKRHGIQTQKAFDNAVVGIAGLGGLGSHIAVSLARLGIGRLILADFDTVEATNLHRQHYIGADIGTPKAWALTRQLQAINPYLTYEPHVVRITPDQVKPLFEPCTIIIEAFDDAETKAWFTQTCLTELTRATLIGASGMAGLGSANTITTTRPFARFYLCGDGASDVTTHISLTAPRVSVCASHMATAAMRVILGRDPLQDG